MRHREPTELWAICWCCLTRYRADAGEGGMVVPSCPQDCDGGRGIESTKCSLHESVAATGRGVGVPS